MGLADHPDFQHLKELLQAAFVRTGFVGGVSRIPVAALADSMLSDVRIDEQIAEISRRTEVAGKRILEVGAGCGALVARGRAEHGLDITGIEPSNNEFGTSLTVAHALLDHYGLPRDAIVEGYGEAMPFPDASFDVVYSTNVLEHVADPEAVLGEAIRVLSPGGTLIFVVPNYGSWWEGHYGILWLPHMPAWLAKLYVRLLGRDPGYVDTLRLITKGRLRRALAPHAGRIEVVDWGWSTFEWRLRSLQFNEWGSLATLKPLIRLLHKARLVDLAVFLCRRFGWETPIILVLRKVR